MREQPLSTFYNPLGKSFLHYFATSKKKMHSAMTKVEVSCREGGEERGEEKKGEERHSHQRLLLLLVLSTLWRLAPN